MAYITTNLGLTAWDKDTDPYNHDELAVNWVLIDGHDHTDGNGAPLPPEALPEITQDNLGEGIIGTAQLADGSVTNPKIANGAVGSTKLANSAVTNGKIANGAVGTAALQDGSVTEPKLATGAVTNAKLGSNAVTNAKIADGQVNSAKLSSQAVTQAKVAPDAISEPKIEDDAVSTSKLQADAVTRPKIGSRAVGVDELGKVPCVFVMINQAQTISSDNLTPIEWDANKYDTDNMWDQVGDQTFVRIRTDGLYLITGGVLWSGSNDSVGRIARIRKNNTPLAGQGPDEVVDEDGLYQIRQSCSGVINCNVGDQIDLAVKHSAGGNRSVKPEGLLTHLSVTWIGPDPNE